ncbi:hypothetical protein AWC38_SpisGene17619 [Stylophora pistillata]|uniref:Uncharacterized protein n=1 Tax=Stylophora pistillata TaxID=50429 RepID=A0A2B4RI09_STYPI|nr:hypothetical protein AWC38_SpisGene17619 [Stylophora pistillata]
MTPPPKMIYSVSPRMTNKSLRTKCLAGKDLNNKAIKAQQRHKEKGTCPESLKYRVRAKIRADEDFKKEIKQIRNNAEQETVKAIMCFHEREIGRLKTEIQKRKRAKTAGTLDTKNCSTIESARAAQAESNQDNVTIETVKKIVVNPPEQIAQFGSMMKRLGTMENKEFEKIHRDVLVRVRLEDIHMRIPHTAQEKCCIFQQKAMAIVNPFVCQADPDDSSVSDSSSETYFDALSDVGSPLTSADSVGSRESDSSSEVYFDASSDVGFTITSADSDGSSELNSSSEAPAMLVPQ